MVTRILKYEATVDADATDVELDSKSPGSNKRWEVQEVYGAADGNHEFSLSYEERKLFDNIPGDELADEDNGIPFDVTVGESEDLAILATDLNSTQDTARFYVRVDESGT
jgi:hypothetical protein